MIERLPGEARRSHPTSPADYSCAVSQSRRDSLAFALAGCAYMLRHQKNMRLISTATLAVIALGLGLQIGLIEWALLIIVVATVWITEFVNGAVEACVNLATAEPHPMAKVAKDVAAGATLLAVIAAALVGLLIFGPPLLALLR